MSYITWIIPNPVILRLRCFAHVICVWCAGKSPTADYISKLEVHGCYFFLCQFIPCLPEFLPYTVCYLIIVRCGQGSSKSFHQDNERLAKNKAFCGHELGKNGVWRDKRLYISSSMAQRAKISLSRNEVSQTLVGNGEVKNRSTVRG